MRDEIKRPMTQDENADDEANSPGAEEAPSGCRRQDRPHDHHDKAVAPWIRLEGEMRKRRIVGVHPHDLEPTEEKKWPQQIETESCSHSRTQRNRRLNLLGSQRYGEMPYEHLLLPELILVGPNGSAILLRG